MNKELLFDSFSYLDEELLARSEETRGARPRKKYAALAACFALILAGVFAAPHILRADTPAPPAPVPDPGQNTDRIERDPPPPGPEPDDPYSYRHFFLWNEREAGAAPDASLKYYALFGGALTAEEYDAVMPDRLFDWMAPEGNAAGEYLGDGTLDAVTLRVGSTAHDGVIQVTLMPEGGTRDRFVTAQMERIGPLESEQIENGVRVTAWTQRSGDWTDLTATFVKDGVRCLFTTAVPGDAPLLERMRDVGDLVFCFEEEPPDLSGLLTCDPSIFTDRRITHAEALADETFGAYFLPEAPEGFALAEPVRRRRDARQDYLYGDWTNGGYGYLEWRVSNVWDEGHVVSAAETDKYDLSLYPIPRSESVPREKWEVVNDPVFRAEELTETLIAARTVRMSEAGEAETWYVSGFTVLYGTTAVHVTAKGVSAEWLYEQLSALR